MPAALAPLVIPLHPRSPCAAPGAGMGAQGRIADMLALLAATMPLHRRIVHAGELVHRGGDGFTQLSVIHCGVCKIVSTTPDGREHVVGLGFRGDWLGLDGIASRRHTCDAVALDTGEIWVLRYDGLLQACAAHPRLLQVLHAEMSRALVGAREGVLARHTLPVTARVADFVLRWATTLGRRGQRVDQIKLQMTRAEIGNYLGMTLESVSRALSRMVSCRVIHFSERGRRVIQIPDLQALAAFVQAHAQADEAEPAASPRVAARTARA